MTGAVNKRRNDLHRRPYRERTSSRGRILEAIVKIMSMMKNKGVLDSLGMPLRVQKWERTLTSFHWFGGVGTFVRRCYDHPHHSNEALPRQCARHLRSRTPPYLYLCRSESVFVRMRGLRMVGRGRKVGHQENPAEDVLLTAEGQMGVVAAWGG